MKFTYYFFGGIVLCASVMVYPFSYDSAIRAAQNGNWQDAHTVLNSIVTDNPDNAEVLHDAGVAAYKLGNFNQAVACFARAGEISKDKDLCFDARFKAGNASVANKDLSSALEYYNKALVIKPNDEYARHNRDRVAQMLQEQQKQDQQKKEDDQKDDQKDEKDQEGKQDQNDKDDQSGNDKDQQDQNDGQDKQQGNDKPGQDSGSKDQLGNQKNQQQGDQSDQHSEGKQGNDATNGDKDTQRKEHGDKEQGQKKSADDKNGNGDHELDQKPEAAKNDRDNKQGKQHGKAPEKQNETNATTNVPSASQQEQDKDGNESGIKGIDDPWLLNVLNNQEQHDKAINKKLMEAKVSQHGGKNGQNCW